MPRVPDYVVNKTAQTFQAIFIVAAIIFGLISWAMFENGHNGFGPALIALILFVIGGMIKTRKKYVGGTGVYR